MCSTRPTGLTSTELLIALAIVASCLLIFWVVMSKWLLLDKMASTVSNMKELHLATEAMAEDGRSMGDKTLRWPGDTDGTYTNWVHLLVPEYLQTNDFCKLLYTYEKPVSSIPSSLNESPILVYAVSSNSTSETVFLSTANFTNSPTGGLPLQRKAVPYGDGGFVVFRKGGDGVVLPARKVGDQKAIGSYAQMLK